MHAALNSAYFVQLADQILARYEQTKQQDADLNRKEDMRVQLENIIHEVMPCKSSLFEVMGYS